MGLAMIFAMAYHTEDKERCTEEEESVETG